eukprot:12169601-Karenia_brevis.AAC.1
MEVDLHPESQEPKEEQEQQTKLQLIESIKQLETALAAIPEGNGNDAVRKSIMEQIEVKKKKLGETKPLGKRLDSARAAYERALKRLAMAEESIALALKAKEAAEVEVEQLKADVASLEAQVAGTPQKAVPTVVELETQLLAAIQQLKEFEKISPAA